MKPMGAVNISSAACPQLAVDIVRRAGAWEDVADELLVNAARAAFSQVRGDDLPSEVCLLLTNDAQTRALNKKWRGMDDSTNVLSFPLDARQGAAGPGLLGDVVLAYETIHREAAGRGIATAQHAAHLVVHAMLHLMGYDHNSGQEGKIMEDLEVCILGSLGLANPYAPQSPTDGEAS